MTQVVDGIVTIVAGLEPEQRKGLVDRLISSGVLSETEEDAMIIASRRQEPTEDYNKFRSKRTTGAGQK